MRQPDRAELFPRYRVALVQNESEMVQAPAYNLVPFLEANPQLEVELFTERNFAVLRENSEQFDCVVIGYNAAHKSKLIRESLARTLTATGLCILHQRRAHGFPRLADDIGASLAELDSEVKRVVVAERLPPEDEILLNWPKAVGLLFNTPPDGRDSTPGRLEYASALCGIVPGPASRWRTVLEVEHEQRYPVLVRTHTGRGLQVIICTALLRPDEPAHAALLGNLVMWCAAGRPHAVVLRPEGDQEMLEVQRKLSLQGGRAVIQRLERPQALDFKQWPVRRTADLIVPGGWRADRPRDAEKWLEDGGRIIQLEKKGISITHRAKDARWVAQLWSAWFHSVSEDSWHGGPEPKDGSIVHSLAILRVLSEFRDKQRQPEIDADRLHLPDATKYRNPIKRMVGTRVRKGDRDCDGTVSTTVAVLELERLVCENPARDGLLHVTTRKAFQAELKRWLGHADTADQLEIARFGGDAESLRRILRAGLPHTLSAPVVTKLREAIVACKLRPDQIPDSLNSALRNHDSVVEQELRISPLLAANFLIALSKLQEHWGTRPSGAAGLLFEARQENVDRAVMTVAKHGCLMRGSTNRPKADPEFASAEALALIAYFRRYPVATHAIPGEVAVPPQLIESLLEEAEGLRQGQADRDKQKRLRTRAQNGFAALTLLLSFALVVALGIWFLPNLPFAVGLLGGLAALLVVPALALLPLRAWEILPDWAGKVGYWLPQGVAGLQKWLQDQFGEDEST